MFEEVQKLFSKAIAFSQEVKTEHPVRIENVPTIFKIDVALLPSTTQEFDSILPLLFDVTEVTIENNDALIYFTGKLNAKKRILNVVVPVPINMGIEASVITTTKIISHFSPEILIMSGICAGNKNVTKIGDLVIAEKSINYNNILEISKSGGDVKKKFMQSADSINKTLKARLALFASHGIQEVFDDIELPKEFLHTLTCHIGLVVTGSSLSRSKENMDEINESYHGVKAMDMETYGMYFAASNSNRDKAPLFVSMKAVSDFGDETSHKVSAEKRAKLALTVSTKSIIQYLSNYYI